MNIEKLYHPNSVELGSVISGLSGSGKTTAVISTLQQAIKSATFGEFHRFIIIDPKTQTGDYDILSEPISDLSKLFKSIRKNRVSLFFPDIDFIENQVSEIVDYVFALSDSEPKTSFTLILDEASTLITPSRIPNSLKRLSVQGRAKRIKPIFISQRPIVNRWTDANVSNLLLFRTLKVDADTLSKRWGVDFEEADSSLQEKPFSFIWFDLNKGRIQKMNPVPLPKPPKKKKSKLDKMKEFFQ